jgi:thioredoxin 1
MLTNLITIYKENPMPTLITQETFESLVTKSSKPVIIDVFAEWCGPCQQMAPVFAELEKEMPAYSFAKINVDESRDLAITFGVTSIPTFVYIKNGQVVGKTIGYLSKEDLRKKITELL